MLYVAPAHYDLCDYSTSSGHRYCLEIPRFAYLVCQHQVFGVISVSISCSHKPIPNSGTGPEGKQEVDREAGPAKHFPMTIDLVNQTCLLQLRLSRSPQLRTNTRKYRQ